MYDPFRQFEQSRAGLMIPFLLFVAGAVPTAMAMGAMISIRANEEVAVEALLPHPASADQVNDVNSDLSTNLQDETDL